MSAFDDPDRFSLPVNIPVMTDVHDCYHTVSVLDVINDAISTHSNPPSANFYELFGRGS